MATSKTWRPAAVLPLLLLFATVAPLGVEAQSAAPSAKPHGRSREQGLVLGIPLGVMSLTPDQEKQVSAILSTYRASVASVVRQLRQEQSGLADRLVAPGQLQVTDLQPQLQQITQLRGQLLSLSAQAMLDIRALLTPEQLAAGAQARARLGQLRSEMRQLLEPTKP